jgi:hypothetical protein
MANDKARIAAAKSSQMRGLRPAKKGEVRNPKGVNGVTKDRQLTDLMHKDGDALLPLDRINEPGLWPTGWKLMWPFMLAIWPKTKTIREFVSHMAWLQAANDSDARNKLQDRIEGKVSQPITGEDGGPLQVQTLVSFVGCGVKAAE